MDWLARIAAARYAPAAGVGLLALAGITEATARTAGLAPPADNAVNAAFLCLLVLATTVVPLIFLRPVAAAVTIAAANVLAVAAFGLTSVAGVAAQVIAVYRLATVSGTRGTIAGVGTQYLAMGLTVPFVALALGRHASASAVLLAAGVPAAAGTGIAVRARREARRQTVTSETLSETLTEHMARGERARIARELHDVVAHHISMISVQAETARLTTPGLPATGAQRLTEIGDTARAGLTEMRRLLGVLREDAEATAADRHPQPGLPQLAELIDTARDAAGTGTRLIVSGPVAGFDPGVELAAYRITQEALTNARRHAPGAAVDVELRYCDDALLLRIRDNGPGPPAAAAPGAEPPGHGLLGMRERAIAVGGSLRTGTAPGGGFWVEAVLPAKPETT